MSKLYRSDSLDSLVSSDDLDQASLLIRFRSFLFLFFFALLIAIAVACSLLIEIPIKVSGPAVIWSDEGVMQVMAKDPGRITSINVKVGDRIVAGDEIAILDQTSVQDKLSSVEEKLDALKKYILAIEKLQIEDKRERNLFQYRISKIQEDSEELNNNRLERLRSRKAELRKLHADGLIQFDQYNLLINQIDDVNESIITENRNVVNEDKEENSKYIADRRELLQKHLEADQLESEVTLLKRQLKDQGKLKTLITGRVVGITASLGDFLTPGSPVILVQPDSGEDNMTFVVFISSEQVKPVDPGDDTELELSAFPPTKYGKLLAEVKSVSPIPLSSSGLMKELRNDQLVERITEEGSPFMVKVDILRDEKTGKFQWSSDSNDSRELQVGMVGQGSIITEYRKLFWLLLPKD